MNHVTKMEPKRTRLDFHRPEDLMRLFNATFLRSHRTELVRGGEEPLYLPADREYPNHRIVFAHNYFSSALHEIAHWCVAGKRRRAMVDYGYWYKPDGRTAEEQKLFEKVEIKPQALEWIFSVACGYRFVFSADNLDGAVGDMSHFRLAVHDQVSNYLAGALPRRARRWFAVLSAYYKTSLTPVADLLKAFDLDRSS